MGDSSVASRKQQTRPSAASSCNDSDSATFTYHDSPHDVLAETTDPYRFEAKKKPPGVEKNSVADHFRDGLSPEATPGEIVDSRLASFTQMGFSAEDAENALKTSNNDLNEALSLLLERSN